MPEPTQPPPSAFQEPPGNEPAGTMIVERPPTPYQRYMATQGIPIYEAPGVRDVRELSLAHWDQQGGKGAFLVPDGTVELLGMHVLEIPPGGVLNPSRHIYEEKYWVVEGEGVTELWQKDSTRRKRFEWHDGSLFAIPINTNFQLMNTSRRRALMIVGNTAPPVLDIFENEEFVFNNDFTFHERYDEQDDYYTPSFETLQTSNLKRAMWRTSIIPDIVHCQLPLDNQRSPGYRRIEPHMAGGNFRTFIGEHMPGRYAKAHAHESWAVLICVKGQGYTYNWPMHVGTTPWQSGHGDLVERVDYIAGGLVAAAPGGGTWFHQHFPTGRDGLRMLVYSGGLPNLAYGQYVGRTRRKVWLNADIEDGGNSISYRTEDPEIRRQYAQALGEIGLTLDMPEGTYE